MEKQKFKEYLKFIRQEKKYFTKENLLLLLGAVIAVGIWYYFTTKYLVAANEEKVFTSPHLLRVIFFDVGQGDAALITTPGGKNILIDAGSLKGATIEESEEGTLITEIDAAEKVLIPYFNQHNISKLDALIITHPHIDHFGGALKILDSTTVQLYVDNGAAVPNPYFEELLKKVRKKKIKYFTPLPGDELPIKEDNLEIKFLTLPRPFTPEDYSSINNSSLVIKLRYKNFTVLFTGDIEKEAELELLNWGEELRATILKIPHHGSQTSSTLPFLEAVNPSIAVISCGRGNPYGHPHDSVIMRLTELGIETLRTDEKGGIVFVTDGIKYTYEILKKNNLTKKI